MIHGSYQILLLKVVVDRAVELVIIQDTVVVLLGMAVAMVAKVGTD